jgi:hypothetical protein
MHFLKLIQKMQLIIFTFFKIMLSDISCKEERELLSTPIVQQTAYWSAVKQKLGDQPLAFSFRIDRTFINRWSGKAGSIVSDLLVVVHKLDFRHSIAYVPYGPELEPEEEYQGLFLEELSECIRPYLPEGCIVIRYDLCWESYWAKGGDDYDGRGDWKGEPGIHSQEFRFNHGTVNWNFKKAHHNILPSHTVFLDLKRNSEDILGAMKPKTRYNIRLAGKKGVTVKDAGLQSLDVWYRLYSETAKRNNICLGGIEYFRAVLQTNAGDSMSPADVSLLVACLDDIPLAAMFLVVSGQRSYYLYGASSSSHRNLMAPYALQWAAINLSRDKGCSEYDMFGVSPNPDPLHPMYGLYRFKTGFGGRLYHRMGCWDYPLSEEKYNEFRSAEMRSPGFHL